MQKCKKKMREIEGKSFTRQHCGGGGASLARASLLSVQIPLAVSVAASRWHLHASLGLFARKQHTQVK